MMNISYIGEIVDSTSFIISYQGVVRNPDLKPGLTNSTSRSAICLSEIWHLYSVGGVKVSIVAFQAIDPGSIPG